jgi:ethanolamine permease
VVTPAVVVFGIGAYADALVDLPNWMWWAIFYGLFVAINVWGTKLTFQVSAVTAVASMVVLGIFYVGALVSGAFDPGLLNNIPPEAGNSAFLPFGFGGVLAALPYAIWFYLAIEQLPLAAEESHDVVKDMPKALIWGIVTLLGLSVLTLVLNTGVGGGAAEVGVSLEPLFIGFTAAFGEGATTTILTLVALTGLIASFHAIIYAYGRILFALSRAGYIPRGLSVVSKRHTPHRALLLGAIVGFVITVVLDAVGGAESPAGAALLNMAVFGAVISYAIVMVSYIALKRRRPDLHRPYVSPLGITGAAVGAVIAVVSLIATFADPAYRPGVYAVAIFMALMLAYYFGYSRHRLVAQAPEEEQALIRAAESELR